MLDILENFVLRKRTLALFDTGFSLSNVLGQLLEGSYRSRIEVGMRLVRSALAMPDHSPHRIQTPIRKVINRGCIQVGNTIIALKGWEPENVLEGKQLDVILDIDQNVSDSRTDRSELTNTRRLQDFVSQIVILRSVGARTVIREWLVTVA